MIVVVTGGRNYSNRDLVRSTLDDLLEEHMDIIVVHGGCNCKEHEPNIGADFFADEWAKEKEIECVPFFADWWRFGQNGGPIRNKQMIETAQRTGREVMMVAFPGGSGTTNAKSVALKHGLELLEIDDSQ